MQKKLSKQHLFIFASFLTPIIVLCIFMYAKQIMPFGRVSLFINSVKDQPFNVFHRFVSQLHNGSFSLLNPSGINNMTMAEAFPFYLGSPFTIIAALFPLTSSYYVLSILNILRVGLSGATMCWFLLMRQRKDLEQSDSNKLLSAIPFILSCAYSLGSSALVFMTDYRFGDIHFLFPLLFYFYDQLIVYNKRLGYYIISTVLLLINPALALSVLLLLFLHLLCIRRLENPSHPITRFISASTFSFLTSAPSTFMLFRSLYYYLSEQKRWPDFFFYNDWLTFFSQLLPNSDSSTVFSLTNGINIYFSLFVLLFSLLALFSPGRSLKIRIGQFIFTCVLLLCLNTTTFDHIISFSSFEHTLLCPYSFVFSFFAILICVDNLSNIRKIPLIPYILLLAVPLCFALISGIHAQHPVRSTDMYPVLIIFVLYLFLFIFYRTQSISLTQFLAISFVILSFELLINSEHQLYNLSHNKVLIDEQLTNIAQSESDLSNPFTEHGVEFDAPLTFDTNITPESYLISGQYTSPNRQAYDFDTANAVYQSLGGKNKMFDVSDLPIRVTPSSSTVHYRPANHNILIFESRDYAGSYHKSNVQFQPEKNGDLYFSLYNIAYAGMASMGNPVSAEIYLPKMQYYANALQIKTAYFNAEDYQDLANKLSQSVPVYKTSFFSSTTGLNISENQTLILPLTVHAPVSIMVDGNSATTISGPNHHNAVFLTQGNHRISLSLSPSIILIPLLISILSIVIWCIMTNRILLPASTSKALSSLHKNSDRIIIKASYFLNQNNISILSFFIPFTILVLACSISNFTPFGSGVYYKTDGAALTIPNLYYLRNLMKLGNPSYSPISGGGSNSFYWNPFPLIHAWLYLFPEGSLIAPATILSIIRIALCGFTLNLYMTHRLAAHRILRRDPRILLFTTAYALSAYNLNMRYFINWPELVGILPLLVLSLDYLMIKKKKSPYIFLLAYCMIINTMNTIYLCIFLFCWFFLYNFNGIKDFLKKALRFGLSSILAAGLSFWILAVNVLFRVNSSYNSTDAVIPQLFKFYQSYFLSLKQLFLFPEAINITTKDGAINLYCGILCLLLVILSILFTKKNKRYWGRLSIIAFILFSSNNDLMSYIWNGFHYQSKVPNRYSFLLIFLIIDMAIDGIIALRKLSTKKLLSATLILVILLSIVTSQAGNEISFLSVSATFIAVTAYAAILLYSKIYAKNNRSLIIVLLVAVTTIELAINNIYTFKTEQAGDGSYIDENVASTDFLKENWLHNDPFTRVSYLSSESVNQHLVNNVASIFQFSSLTTSNQSSMASSYGFYNSSNNIISLTNETPYSNSMLNIKYMIVAPSIPNSYIDTNHYDVIGRYDDRLILRNNRNFSTGFYIPKNAFDKASTTNSVADLANTISECMGVPNPVFPSQKTLTLENDGGITPKSLPVNGCYIEEYIEDSLSPYMATIKVVPKQDGEYYYRNSEFFYLGELSKDVEYTFQIPIRTNEEGGYLVQYDDNAFQQLYDTISRNNLKLNASSSYDHIQGSINFPEDGYILLSFPYEKGWNIYLDGEKADFKPFCNGALLIEGHKGQHTLKMEFESPGKATAIWLTIPFWIIYFIIFFIEYGNSFIHKFSRQEINDEKNT